MLTNIPTADSIAQNALRLYFTAWDQVLGILEEMRQTDVLDFAVKNGRMRPNEGNEQEVNDFIGSSQHDLQVAYTLIQQNQEIGLKAKIGSISPFLLLLGSGIRTWPSPDSDFTRFRTLDSSDLVKVVNSVSPQLLSSKFATLYDTVRGDRTKSITRVRLLTGLIRSCCSKFLVDQYAELYPTRMWLQDRLDSRARPAISFLYSPF